MTMPEFKLKLEQNKTIAVIELELPLQLDKQEKVTYATSHVIRWLESEKGFKTLDIIKPRVVTNINEKRRKGKWVLKVQDIKKTQQEEKINEITEKVKPTRTRKTKIKKEE